MDMSNRYQFYIGTVRGVIISTSCKPEEAARFDTKNINTANEITSMRFGRTENEVIVGFENNHTILYDTLLNKDTHYINDPESEGGVVGVGAFNENVIIGYENGKITTWRNEIVDTLNTKVNYCLSTMQTMACNKYREGIVGTGGRINDFKLWDLNTKKCIFKAKASRSDDDNSSIITTVSGICFFPHDEKLNAICTKEGYLNMYDERVRRKAIAHFCLTNISLTSVTSTFRERECIVGTAKGFMKMVDLRMTRSSMKTYSSFAGSVTDIVCDPYERFVASVSLDRHLRIHNIDTSELVYKEYLKQSLTRFVMKPLVKKELPIPTDSENSSEEDEDYDELFENMEKVGDGERKKLKRKSPEIACKRRKKN